jgi:hypothetical protein
MSSFEKIHLLQAVNEINDYTNFVVSEVNNPVIRISVFNRV